VTVVDAHARDAGYDATHDVGRGGAMPPAVRAQVVAGLVALLLRELDDDLGADAGDDDEWGARC
jgi:hypothetical protein